MAGSEDALTTANLAYFRQIITDGSLTAAARNLGISQPSLSVAVRKMEESLGTTLIHRGRAGVTPTATGEILATRAKLILDTLDSLRADLVDVEGQLRGAFSIGCHESLAAYTLAKFLLRFSKSFPDIQLNLSNRNSQDVEQAIVRRELDLGFVVNPEGHDECVVRPLFQDRVEFIVSAAALKRAGKKDADVLSGLPMICVPELRQTQYLLAEVTRRGLRMGSQIECSSLALAKSFVLDGVGVGILPHRVANYGVATGKLHSLTSLPYFDDQITLVRRFDMHMTHAAKVTWEALEEHGRSMPELPKRGRGKRS